MRARLGRATLTDGFGVRHIDYDADGIPIFLTSCVVLNAFFIGSHDKKKSSGRQWR